MLALLAGCGDDDELRTNNVPPASSASPPGAAGSAGGTDAPQPELSKARCPADLSGCETASGTVIYVERVDPDGDGDAHFVLASKESITFPGVSVIDVRKDLRPDPLPGPGDRVSAAGPVFPGSYGQSQIQAEVVNVATR